MQVLYYEEILYYQPRRVFLSPHDTLHLKIHISPFPGQITDLQPLSRIRTPIIPKLNRSIVKSYMFTTDKLAIWLSPRNYPRYSHLLFSFSPSVDLPSSSSILWLEFMDFQVNTRWQEVRAIRGIVPAAHLSGNHWNRRASLCNCSASTDKRELR